MPTTLYYHPAGRFFRSWGRRKYRPGEPIMTVGTMVALARVGHWFFCDIHTPKHGSILLNQSVLRIASLIERREIRVAIRTPEFPYVFKAVWHQSFAKPAVKSEWWATCSEFPGVSVIATTRKSLLKKCVKCAEERTGLPFVNVTVELDR